MLVVGASRVCAQGGIKCDGEGGHWGKRPGPYTGWKVLWMLLPQGWWQWGRSFEPGSPGEGDNPRP